MKVSTTAYERALSRAKAPAPRAGARERARDAALAEFARVQAANELTSVSQDSGAEPRPSRIEQRRGRFPMFWMQRRSLFGAFASATVVLFATAMLWPVISGRVDLREFTGYETELPAAQPPPARQVAAQPVAAKPAPPEETRAEPLAAARGGARQEMPAPGTQAATSGDRPVIVRPDEKGRVNIRVQPAAEPVAPVYANAKSPAEVAEGFRQLQREQGANRPAPARIVDEIQILPNAQALERKPGVVVANQPQEMDELQESVVVTGARGELHASASRSRLKKDKDLIEARNNAAPPAPPPAGRVVTPEEVQALRRAAEGDDKFQHFDSNPIKRVAEEPVSTFSVDVDTSSYSFVRRMLNEGRLPQKDAVRVEEMVNYFDYAWPRAASREAPFEPTIAVTDSPWNRGRKLVHVGIKGYDVPRDGAPDVNLVLLLDVSGSMDQPDKLPLAVQSMELLLGSLKPTDTVGIVVYAGAAGTVLEPTPVREKQKIVDALRSLTPGGSTAGAEGIERAYQLAQRNFRRGGVNRVLLATDGDFNVGLDSTEELKGYVERQREKGVMLSVLGFGEGNYRDELAQALAQNGNGVAAYIDTLSEAQKVLVDESSGTLFTIAKDVKIQVEFNPAAVAEYRLVGYETRALKREDFNNDAVDAGDVGSGHTVTAIYEITPVGSEATSVDPLRYGANAAPAGARAAEYGFVKVRYKLPDESKSRLISKAIPIGAGSLPVLVEREVRFSTAVAGFAQLLRGGQHTGALTFDDVIHAAQGAKGDDPFGYRTEFVQLVRKAKSARGM